MALGNKHWTHVSEYDLELPIVSMGVMAVAIVEPVVAPSRR